MAHAFDTGAALPQRTRIRRGVVQILSGLKRPAGYILDVVPFGSVVRSHLDEIGVAQLVAAVARMPAIAVAVADRSSSLHGMGGYREKCEIDLLVYLANNNARDALIGRMEIDSAGAASDQADPGLEVMMEHAKELLLGQYPTIGDDINQLRPDREEELYTGEQITIWLQTYKITAEVLISQFRTVTQLLESIRFRSSMNLLEEKLPGPATDPSTIDVHADNL